MSWWTANRQAYAFSFLTGGAGLSPYGAAGLVSRWANVEAGGGPASRNPSSGAFGIAQWLGARKAGINGNTDFAAQLGYAANELNSSERRAGDVLRAARTADEGARGASMYERAEGYNANTGRDNYTARTAAGIANVLASVSGLPSPVTSLDDATTGEPSSYASPAPVVVAATAGLGVGVVAAIGAGLLLLYLAIDD